MTEKEKLMLEEMMVNADQAVIDNHANELRKLYQAYLKAGFTAKQSLELVKQWMDTAARTNMLIRYDSRKKQPPQ